MRICTCCTGCEGGLDPSGSADADNVQRLRIRLRLTCVEVHGVRCVQLDERDFDIVSANPGTDDRHQDVTIDSGKSHIFTILYFVFN